MRPACSSRISSAQILLVLVRIKPFVMLLLFQSAADAQAWRRSSLDDAGVMLLARARRRDSMGRAVANPSVV